LLKIEIFARRPALKRIESSAHAAPKSAAKIVAGEPAFNLQFGDAPNALALAVQRSLRGSGPAAQIRRSFAPIGGPNDTS